jgi:hypothetical protein
MVKQLIRDLGDGLILRYAKPADEETLVKFNRGIHGESEWDEKALEEWTRDLISGESPVFETSDIIIVEDTKTNQIVSTCCLISQIWSYEGVPFKVGRPELVGTLKEYRRRGFVREQFNTLHEWSAERGELVQVITGIPFYYRQFGYEMALNLSGGRYGYEMHVPELKEDEEEPYHFRPAEERDIPFLMKTYERGCHRSMISSVYDEDLWRYEITWKRKYNINRREIYIIENQAGNPIGFIGLPPVKWGHSNMLNLYEIDEGIAWTDVTPSVIRFLWQNGLEKAEEQGTTQKIFGFWLGESHPAYEVAATKIARKRKPYAYYMRVPDLAAFLNLIKPVLESRLAESAFVNYTGELKLSFYRDGLSMKFEKGKITSIENIEFDELEGANAQFPPFTFLHLVFGHRSVDELKYIYIDCGTKDEETANLIDALFPKKVSEIWPVS